MNRPVQTRNRAKCAKCGMIVESQSRHDLQACSCGSIAVDGGRDYMRRVGYPRDFIELADDGTEFPFEGE